MMGLREGLSASEKSHECALLQGVNVFWLVQRLQQSLGISISAESAREFEQDISFFEFVYCDIVEISPKIRFMNILDEAEVRSLLIASTHRQLIDEVCCHALLFL
jgi:hypothetical protein